MAYTVHNFEQGDVLYADQLNEMDAQIAANEESIENSVSSDMLAENYSANKTYSIGDYVIYNNELYTCIYEITAPEGWNSAHWRIANLGDGISDLSRQISDVEESITHKNNLSSWEQGTYYASNGTNYNSSTTDIRNSTKIGIANGCFSVSCNDGYKLLAFAYDSTDAYVGVYKTNGTFEKTTSNLNWVTSFDFATFPTYKFKFALEKNDTSTITLADGVNVFYHFATDNTLSEIGKSADAKIVGDYIFSDKNIVWNQFASYFTRASGSLGAVTYTRSTDEKQATFNGTPSATDFYQVIQSGLGESIVGHKYAIFTPRISGSSSGYWFFYLNNRTVRDTGNGAIWTADSATNMVVGIEWNTSNNLPTFNNLTVNVPIITDLTECFGAGNEPTIEEFRAMFPNNYYPYNSGTQRKLTQIEKNSLDIYHNTFAVAKTQSSVKLKILTFNCGHYNYGSGSEGTWSGDELAEKIKLWKNMLTKYKPDIMFGQEMSQYFDAAQTVNAIGTIFNPLLPNYYFYAWTRLLSKYAFQRTWQEDATVTVGGTTYSRSFGAAIINVNGVDILICSVHLPAGYTANDTAVREAMRDKIITAFSSYPYVILGGDFNESTDSFYTPFVNAGYALGNHGYFGTITTLPNESVDNIIVKGFAFYDAVSNSADACTSDHYPFASEIHIT